MSFLSRIKFNKFDLCAMLGAIPLTMSIQMVDSPTNWFMLTLTFLCGIDITSLKLATRRALIIGTTTAFINFFWILNGATKFTGSSFGFFLGILIVLVFVFCFCIYTSLIGGVYVLFQWKKTENVACWLNSIMGGCLFVFLDAVMMEVGKGFSTCMYVNFIPFGMNSSAIQYLPYVGPLIITFVVGMIDYQVAYLIYHKKWKLLWVPGFILLMFLAGGNYLKTTNTEWNIETQNPNNSAKIALVTNNVAPSMSWDSAFGNKLVNYLFSLNQKALASGADEIIWPETIVPWTYESKDPFLNHLFQMSQGKDVNQVIGVNTFYQERTFYNSLYSFDSKGNVLGRYDKRNALYLVEKPLAGILLPFLSSMSFRVREGHSNAPLLTKYGMAGILLCNESSISSLARSSVNEGAEYLINPGNDGWFSDTYITKEHFYHSRMRAIENRKYVLVNNNNGYSGVIAPDGNILDMERSGNGLIISTAIVPNQYKTFYDRYPHFFLLLSMLIFGTITAVNFKRHKSFYY